jgi:hypothetical protein
MIMTAMAQEMPARMMLMMGGGNISRPIMDALLIIMNGKLMKGISALMKAVREKRESEK